MGSLLVTGGAGYVGSHAVRQLQCKGEKIVVLDDLSEGHRQATAGVDLVVADLADTTRIGSVLDELFQKETFDVVLHFAGRAYVGESVRDPERYYRINVGGGIELLSAMARNGVPRIIFSSTCATYGEPDTVPILEDHPQRPLSAYGRTKLAFELALKDFEIAHGIRHINFRYFNAAGAHPDGTLGEDHRPETHLIPLVCDAALGLRPAVDIFGTDYPTPDGTCIRDYIHVVDLADAHILGVEALRSGASSTSYNLGMGHGYSVLEVVESVKRVSGRDVTARHTPRRPGDPPSLVASSQKASDELGWKPSFKDLDDIVKTAWQFKQSYPQGYSKT